MRHNGGANHRTTRVYHDENDVQVLQSRSHAGSGMVLPNKALPASHTNGSLIPRLSSVSVSGKGAPVAMLPSRPRAILGDVTNTTAARSSNGSNGSGSQHGSVTKKVVIVETKKPLLSSRVPLGTSQQQTVSYAPSVALAPLSVTTKSHHRGVADKSRLVRPEKCLADSSLNDYYEPRGPDPKLIERLAHLPSDATMVACTPEQMASLRAFDEWQSTLQHVIPTTNNGKNSNNYSKNGSNDASSLMINTCDIPSLDAIDWDAVQRATKPCVQTAVIPSLSSAATDAVSDAELAELEALLAD